MVLDRRAFRKSRHRQINLVRGRCRSFQRELPRSFPPAWLGCVASGRASTDSIERLLKMLLNSSCRPFVPCPLAHLFSQPASSRQPLFCTSFNPPFFKHATKVGPLTRLPFPRELTSPHLPLEITTFLWVPVALKPHLLFPYLVIP